ncbi:related to ATP-binding cassette (ABC) transporter [Melanopsichium pennsylvanicum]|uniref:Related to ATP-binding cassette (ABC) transporter n=2 Tax=Melanopsichium pennsylvanicum TaxID=63383 RepID=A0AAJ4XMH0_9BASI|nr:related to ATP-binding cassette (ABC) transporter [Melanopsichium pennsylvanicum 4]SNX85069.1 related to ATP-binding cassette (ABC) transporter [Melanopsichium pennsylvanicum]
MAAYTDSICVFCGSSPGSKPEYMAAAASVGHAIAKHNYRLVYGGGSRGCMSGISQAVFEAGGIVLGVIPQVMATTVPSGHPGHNSSSTTVVSNEGTGPTILNPTAGSGHVETVVVQSMHERKQRMAAESNLGFIGLPGGFGTFEEVMEMVTWTQLGIHRKPMVLLNVNGFFSPLKAQIELAVQEGFISAMGKQLISFVDCASSNLDAACDAVLAESMRLAKHVASNGSGYWDWNKPQGPLSTADGGIIDNGAAKQLSLADGEQLAVEVSDLTFRFRPDLPASLEHCNIHLKRGSRCLLIGANGAGKSTILRLLAGKKLCDSKVRVFGKDVFRESPSGVTYLGTEWAMNPVVRSDIVVSTFLDSVGGYRHKARRDRLLDILDVDLTWHMHAISDGERRRVQLCMGLMEPWDLLLLDEVTVDLDVQVRADLLDFLQQETEERGATIIYATHIFDGLQSFPTHLAHMRLGTTTTTLPIDWPATNPADIAALPPTAIADKERDLSPLLNVSLAWLREDKVVRAQEEEKRGRRRGANRQNETTDSERFFSKYDYSQTVTR